MDRAPSLDDIRSAHARIAPHIQRTPVLTSGTFDREFGAKLFFKCENFQKAGAFKARGATNAVLAATDAEVQGGVVTHSSGNHAAALARAAGIRGVPGYIVMPDNAPKAKVESVKRYGGKIVFCEPTLAARETNAARIQAETGAMLVHPFDNWRVIAGQATAALELLEEVPDLEIVIAPVGGGGLLTGTTLSARALKPGIEVYGAEPEIADDAARSWHSGMLQPPADALTIADGLRTGLGERPFSILRDELDDILTASEEVIGAAMRRTWEVMKIIIEPSAAVPLAALIEGGIDISGKRIGIIVTGGNLDLDRLPWLKG